MSVIHHLHGLGKPAWILLTILGLMVWWPLGLATAAFGFGSGRLGWGRPGRCGRWYNVAEGREQGARWFASRRSSGNRAFDEYRDETLKRLEEEQREFRSFLDRLRRARDKAEFDQFMGDRRRPPQAPSAPADQG